MGILDGQMEKMFRNSKKELVDNSSFYLHDITIDVFETVFQLRSKRINMVSNANYVVHQYIISQLM